MPGTIKVAFFRRAFIPLTDTALGPSSTIYTTSTPWLPRRLRRIPGRSPEPRLHPAIPPCGHFHGQGI